jgi:hypothetical protein
MGKENEVVSEETKDEVTTEEVITETAEEKKIREENERNSKAIRDAQDLAKKIYDELIITSDLPYMSVEIVPQFLSNYIKILKGKSKKWEVVSMAIEDFNVTKVNELELFDKIKEEAEM